MSESTMLMISHDPTIIEPVVAMVRPLQGLKLAVLGEIEEAHSYDAWDRVALVLIHLDRGGTDAEVVRLLRMISAARRPAATLVVADRQDADQALTLLRLGVADYLGRPLDRDRLAHLAEVLTVRAREAAREPTAVAPRAFVADPAGPVFDAAGEDEAADPFMDQVRRVAPQDATILLGGETGTGKTLLARRVHELSGRRGEPFVVVNCGSLAPSQVEAEMFGQARGSPIGPKKDAPGKFAEVGRGTLFLDEIDALPMSLQPRLLRVVEDRVFEAATDDRSVPIRARLIAASNLDLAHEVEEGRFRSDLYYRLNVIGLGLPPLRERRGAISRLVARFIAESAATAGCEVESISAAALRALEDYDWPGNVRELKNTIERAVALGHRREIQLGDLPEAITRRDLIAMRRAASQPTACPASGEASSTLAEIKRDAEFARITEALEKHSNNRLRAASELGISRMTLYKKLYKYGLMHQSPAGRGR